MVNSGGRVVGVCVAALLGLGCRKDTAAPVNPEAGSEAAPTPADSTFTYVSGASAGEPATSASEVPTEDEAAPATAPGIAAKVDNIAAARTLVDEVVAQLLGPGERIVAPALVPTWPTKERVLVFVVFPLEASKTGINTFVVGAPLSVTVDLVEGTTAHKKLKRSVILETMKLGRDAASVRENLAIAEQTLIEVLLEKRPVERSLMLLDGYREWFNHHLDIMTDLDKRLPTAVRWLRQPTVDGQIAG